MPHKGRHLAVGATHRDTLVDATCEVGDTVLEVMMGNLHNVCNEEDKKLRHDIRSNRRTRFVLNNSNFGALGELARSIPKAILRERIRIQWISLKSTKPYLGHDCVGIDNENDVTDADRPGIVGPGLPLLTVRLIYLLNCKL